VEGARVEWLCPVHQSYCLSLSCLPYKLFSPWKTFFTHGLNVHFSRHCAEHMQSFCQLKVKIKCQIFSCLHYISYTPYFITRLKCSPLQPQGWFKVNYMWQFHVSFLNSLPLKKITLTGQWHCFATNVKVIHWDEMFDKFSWLLYKCYTLACYTPWRIFFKYVINVYLD
jgi:hypothetical protein